MTVNTTNSQVAYTGNGITAGFTINFQFYSQYDLVVTLNDVLQPYSNYTVTGGNGTTGYLAFNTAPANNVQIIISRVLPLVQQATFVRNEPFPSATHEMALDRIVMMIQQTVAGTGGDGGGIVSQEVVQDIVGQMFGGPQTGINFLYNDDTGLITATVFPGIGDVPSDDIYYVRRNGQWIQMNWNDVANKPTTFPPTTHTHTSTDITDLVESVQDTIAPMFIHSGHVNISYVYDDTTGQITTVSSAGTTDDAGTWLWDETNAMTDPGAGKVRGNMATMPTITSLSISNADSTGAFKNIFALVVGDTLIISNSNQATPGKFVITSITPNTGYTVFGVTPDTVYSLGNPVANDPMTIGGVVSGGGGGGTGGGIGEAPNDSTYYARASLDWRHIPFAGLVDVPTTFTPSAHTHVSTDITDLTTVLNTKVNKVGDTMTGALTLPATDPTAAAHAANKQYVDTKTAGVPKSSDTPPSSPVPGQMWWDSTTGNLFIWYSDPDSSQWVQVSGSVAATPTAQSYNRMVNGAMQISQENGNTAGTVSGYFVTDQFRINSTSSSGAFTFQRVQSVTPNGSRDRIRITVNTADTSIAAGEMLGFSTYVEGLRMADFLYGTASAKQSILRFGFKAPAGTYSVSLRNGAYNRSYLTNFTITAGQANTDTEQVIVIPGDVTGTWAVDNNLSTEILIALTAGTTYQGVAGWQAGNFLGSSLTSNGMGTAGNVFELFDVGWYLDRQNTGVAPAWQMPDYAQELRACQRYWQVFNFQLALYGAAGSQLQVTVPLKCPMRTTPTQSLGAAGTNGNVNVIDIAQSIDSCIMLMTPVALGPAACYNRTYNLSARM